MNKESKIAVLNALKDGQISKEEAVLLLELRNENMIFRTIIYPNGKTETLGDHSLVPLLNKTGVNFIHIKRKIIK